MQGQLGLPEAVYEPVLSVISSLRYMQVDRKDQVPNMYLSMYVQRYSMYGVHALPKVPPLSCPISTIARYYLIP